MPNYVIKFITHNFLGESYRTKGSITIVEEALSQLAREKMYRNEPLFHSVGLVKDSVL